ncbi:MAG: DUF2190 family protein [Firmicutes bacterium]|nr:DUF2190 family protein [Bacillota bacterium]
MAYEIPVFDFTLEAAADLSASQYRFVRVDANGRAALCGAGQPAVGVLQNKPSAAGQAAQVRALGITKVVAGAAIAKGALVASDASGQAVAATVTTANTTTGALTGSHVAGIALEAAAAAGGVISVLLLPMGAVPGTAA